MTGLLNRLLACVLTLTIALGSPAAAAVQAAQDTPAPAPFSPAATTTPAKALPKAAPTPVTPSDSWPRTTTFNGATISVFQPQVDSWIGNQLKAYAAVRIKTATKQDTDYGVIWFMPGPKSTKSTAW